MQTLVLKRSFAFVAALFTATLLMQVLVTRPADAAIGIWVWDGGGTSDDFSDALNWESDVAPTGQETIYLNTDGMTGGTFNNDIENVGPGVSSFDAITLVGTGSGTYTLTGNTVNLLGGGSRVIEGELANNGDEYNYAKFVVEVDLVLGADVTFRSGSNLTVGASDGSNTLDLSTFTMTKTGDYPLKINSALSGSGDVTVSNGEFVAQEDSTVALVIESGGTLKGNNVTVGDVTVNSGGALAPGLSPGCITTGDLVLAGTFEVEIDGAAECTGYDRTNVTGAVDVTGATLDVQRLSSYDPTAGGAVFLIIDNDAADVVTGTFAGLAEGETATFDGVDYVVSYVGGDGNDVTLAVADVPAAPDTGFGLSTSNYLLVLAFTAFATIGLVFTARKLKKINA